MRKSDLALQIFIFGLSAAIITLLVLRLYPSRAIKRLSKNANPTPAAQTRQIPGETPPAAISIPAISLNLAISPGVIKNNQWTLYDDKISWLTTSEPPGRGNVILYGHNRKGLFGDLDQLKVGEKITIKNETDTFIYQIGEVRRIRPNEVDVIISDKNQLTLYTCDGSFDERRLVLFAYPQGESI